MGKAPDSARLGLGDDARQDEIEARYQELSEFLRSDAVPPSLRHWATEQSAVIDEAYVTLTGPEPTRPKPAPAPRRTRTDCVVRDEAEEDDESAEEVDGDEEERRERQ